MLFLCAVTGTRSFGVYNQPSFIVKWLRLALHAQDELEERKQYVADVGWRSLWRGEDPLLPSQPHSLIHPVLQGIYLGANSMTSSNYARATSGWDQSLLGPAPTCLALVEVANSSRVHHHNNGSIIVVSDEGCVMLRYLFLFPQKSIPSIAAKSLMLKKYRNETTIAYGRTLEEVEKDGKLLETSDEYFWDIDEVVAMVKGKNGLFM